MDIDRVSVTKNRLIHYFSNAVLRVKYRSMVLWSSVAATIAVLLICVMQQPPKQPFPLSTSMGIRLAVLTILTVALCYSIESHYVASAEYKYFRSLPIPRSVRFWAIIIRQLPFSNAISLIVALSTHGTSQSLLLIPYINLLIIAISTFIYHLVSLIKQAIRKPLPLKYGLSIVFVLSLFCASVSIIKLPKDEALSLITEGSNSIVLLISSPHAGILLLASAWLVCFYFLKRPYELVLLSRRLGRTVKHGPVYRRLLSNLIVKDALTALRSPMVMIFILLQLAMGAYLAYHQVDLSFSAIFILISALVTSTLTEQFFHDETVMRSLLKTLPVDLKKYFWARIFSVSLILATPSFAALWMQAPFSNFRPLGFLLSALAVFAVVFLWCGMQCSVILSSLASKHSMQTRLSVCVLISIPLPILPLFFLLTGYRKAITSYCEG